MDGRHLPEQHADGRSVLRYLLGERTFGRPGCVSLMVLTVCAGLGWSELSHATEVRPDGHAGWRQCAEAGKAAYIQGDLKGAEAHCRKALRIAEDGHWKDRRLVHSLNNLASVRLQQGRLKEAERILQRALRVTRNLDRQHEQRVAACLFNLAFVHKRQGRHSLALRECQQAVELLKKIHGVKHLDYASGLNNLGDLYLASKQHDRSRRCYERSLAISNLCLGPHHLRVAVCLSNLATVFRAQGKLDDAQRVLERANAIAKRADFVASSDAVLLQNNLAMIYLDQRQYARAESLLGSALRSTESRFGSSHPLVIDPLMSLADCHIRSGRTQQAKALYHRAGRIAGKRLPRSHTVHESIRKKLAWVERTPEKETLKKGAETKERQLMERFPVGKNGRLILLPLKFEHKTYSFLVDTGAPITLFDSSLKNRLGEVIRTIRVRTQNGVKQLLVFKSPKATIGSLPVQTNGSIVCADLSQLRRVSGHNIRGILGMDFLRRHVIRIDCERGDLSFLKSANNAVGTKVVFTDNRNRTPSIEAVVAGIGKRMFAISTGSSGSGTITSSDFRQLKREGAIQVVGNAMQATLTGQQKQRSGRLQKLQIANVARKGVIFRESAINTLGLEFLACFTVTFDFPNRVAYLKPGKNFSEPDEHDRSGLHLLRDRRKTTVDSVDKNTPAARAGIRAGDVLVSLNGTKMSHMDLFTIRGRLSKAGAVIAVTYRRSGADHEARLILPLARSNAFKTSR